MGEGNTTFRDTEKKRYEVLKERLFSPAACQPGVFRGIGRSFCLAEGYSAENICAEFREEAIAYFRERHIPWHNGLPNASGNLSGVPSSHLCCSQCACVNALYPLSRDSALLYRVFQPFLSDMAEPLPFEADGLLPSGEVPYVAFEWIGTRNYLEERSWGTRGANATSADFAFRFRRGDGRIQLVLGEWKYTEHYRRTPPDPRSVSPRRLATYRVAFRHWATSRVDLPPYVTFFVEPFYQLMRLTLLAQAMERACAAGQGEMNADIVSVVHVAPAANRDFASNLAAAPALAAFGQTVHSVWAAIAPDGRFFPIESEALITTIKRVAPDSTSDWRDYLLSRYGWFEPYSWGK